MRSRRLFWVAIGAGLASFAFLLIHFLPLDKPDTRFLTISIPKDAPDDGAAIAAIGACLPRFTMILPDHDRRVVVPIKSLEAKDFVCLTDKLDNIQHQMAITAHEF